MLANGIHSGVFLLLFVLESRRAQGSVVRHWRGRLGNLALGLSNLPFHVVASVATAALTAWVARHHVGLLTWLDLPLWARVAAGAVALDLTDYGYHRLEHALPLLWRIHRVHHTDTTLDVSTSLRSHPGSLVCHWTYQACFIALLGVPFAAITIYYTLLVVISHWQHANIASPPAWLERVARWLVNTPALHRLHHSREAAELDTNFSDVLSVWDRLFGTHRAPSAAGPSAFGVDGHRGDDGLGGLLLTPLRSGTP